MNAWLEFYGVVAARLTEYGFSELELAMISRQERLPQWGI